MKNSWLAPLQRQTTSGTYMPEVDFLRFIAITAVVLYHIHGFLLVKLNKNILFEEHVDSFLKNGDLGVQLFFVLSGFILALPFAKSYFESNKSPNLRKFYIRRVTRLEPPYILLMTLLLLVAILYKNWPLNDAITSYLYSIGYLHNLLAGDLSKLVVVTWSLEIEIFFYVVFPLLALSFKLSKYKRRSLLLLSMCLIPYFNYYVFELKVPNILGYFQYFAAGMLLADLYLTEKPLKLSNVQNWFSLLISVFVLFVINIEDHAILNFFIYPLIITSFYYLVLSNASSFKLYKSKYLAIIGGMCYSMYLIHYLIISLVGNTLLKYLDTNLSAVIFFIVISSVILVGTIAFYLILEKPFMNPKWYIRARSTKQEESLVKTTA